MAAPPANLPENLVIPIAFFAPCRRVCPAPLSLRLYPQRHAPINHLGFHLH
jgi:hypothetical protein